MAEPPESSALDEPVTRAPDWDSPLPAGYGSLGDSRGPTSPEAPPERADRWAVTSMLRRLQRTSPDPSPAAAPASTNGNGTRAFETNGSTAPAGDATRTDNGQPDWGRAAVPTAAPPAEAPPAAGVASTDGHPAVAPQPVDADPTAAGPPVDRDGRRPEASGYGGQPQVADGAPPAAGSGSGGAAAAAAGAAPLAGASPFAGTAGAAERSPALVDRPAAAWSDDAPTRTDPSPHPERPLPPEPMSRRERTAQRRGRRRSRATVRHIDVWTVARASILYYLVILGIFVVADVLIWYAADAFGTLPSIEKSIRTLFSLKSFKIHPGAVAMYTAGIGIVLTIAGTLANIIMALMYNLIADVVGGVRVELETGSDS